MNETLVKDIDGNDVLKYAIHGNLGIADGSPSSGSSVGPTVFRMPVFAKGGFSTSSRATGDESLTSGLTATILYRELASNKELNTNNIR